MLTLGDLTVKPVYEPISEDNFTYVSLPDDTLQITGYTGDSKDIIIPESHEGKIIKVIGQSAFSGSDIESIKFGYGIETIEAEAFYNTGNLKSISLPNSLKTIENRAFAYSAIPEIIIPDSVTNLGEQVFACSTVRKVKLSDSLEILDNIFYYCTELENVVLGRNIKTINKDAFYKCPKLEQLTIPANVELIKPEAFVECNALNSVTFEHKNWSVYNGLPANSHAVDSSGLEDSATAAKYLTAVYYGLYWTKA